MSLRFAIAFISAAVLGYEILLTRLLSIIQWHHFAYMIISLALLGFGASGTFLSMAQRRLIPRWRRSFAINATLFGITILACFSLAQRIPFNALEIGWDIRQLAYLFGLYLLLTLPFFCAANCIGLALTRFKEQIHQIYRFDLLGAGLGALGIVALLFFLSPSTCLRVLSGYALLAAAIIQARQTKKRIARFSGLVLAIVLPLAWPASWLQLQLSEYKGLPFALRVPDAEIISEHSSPLGLLTTVKSPTRPFRHAPGVSLNSQQEPPPQLGIFTDGDAMTAITRYDGRRDSLRYLDFTTAALPYHLLKNRSKNDSGWREPSFGPSLQTQPKNGEDDRTRVHVLILGAGGGSDVLLAKYHQAQKIDAVELNPQIVKLVRETHRDFAGNIYGSDAVDIHITEARSFVAQSRQQGKHYDLIQVSLLDSFSASSAGLYALNENYIYTVESLQAMISLLAPDGLLAITRWLKIPPRDSLKLVATAREALETSGITSPAQQLAMIRSWKTTSLLIKKGPFTNNEIERLRKFCDERSFDIVFYPNMSPHEANRFNQLSEAYLYKGVQELVGANRSVFMRDYKFHLNPATDDSPYFFHFLKWQSLAEILSLRKQGGLGLMEWGYPILIATLLQAIVASLFFILLPLRWLARQSASSKNKGPVLLYFAALGLAFLFIEMAFIQRFILFLGHPLSAIAVVLCGFLVFAGLGSGASARLVRRCGDPRLAITLAILLITAISVLYYFLLPLLFDKFLPWPDTARIFISLLLIAPLAYGMGMPFPLGLRLLADQQAHLIPWAWAINGCASVLSAVLATLLAIHFGFTAVIAIAVGLYLFAATLSKGLMSARRGMNCP